MEGLSSLILGDSYLQDEAWVPITVSRQKNPILFFLWPFIFNNLFLLDYIQCFYFRNFWKLQKSRNNNKEEMKITTALMSPIPLSINTLFWDMALLYNSGWPGTLYIAQVGFYIKIFINPYKVSIFSNEYNWVFTGRGDKPWAGRCLGFLWVKAHSAGLQLAASEHLSSSLRQNDSSDMFWGMACNSMGPSRSILFWNHQGLNVGLWQHVAHDMNTW